MYAGCRRVGLEGLLWSPGGVGGREEVMGGSPDLAPWEEFGLGTRSERWWELKRWQRR